MQLSGLDIAVIVAFFAINLGIGLYFARGSGKSVGEYFLSGPQRAVVADRRLDGRDDVRRRHAARRDGLRRAERDRRQLAVVEHGRERHPDRVLLRRAVAALGRAHRRRVHRAALRRQAGVRAARRARGVPRRARQHDHHGLGQPRDGEDPHAHAARADAARALRVPRAHRAVRHDRRLLVGARHRLSAVHREDDDGGRARGRRGRRRRRDRRAEIRAGGDRRAPRQRLDPRVHAAWAATRAGCRSRRSSCSSA